MLTWNTEKPPKGWCLSTDTKPTGLKFHNGAKITEIDTHEEYYYDESGDQWCAKPTPEAADG